MLVLLFRATSDGFYFSLLASVKASFFMKNLYTIYLQVRLCREKKSGDIYAMKKLKKSEMLSRGQVSSDINKSYLTFLKCILDF